MKTYTLKIIEVRRETEDAITICFKQPALKKISYLPGQYIALILNINGRRYRRPYSLSSTPSIDQTLNITVKRVEGGIISNYLNDNAKEGDIIEVLEPLGNFVFPVNEQLPEQLYLWGAGSGITPLYSILRDVLKRFSEIKVVLVYCNKNPNTAIFNASLLELLKTYPSQLSIVNYYSSAMEIGGVDIHCGERLSTQNIHLALGEFTEAGSTQHYICGPALLKALVRKAIKKLNVPDANIFCEEFEHSINETELKDVHTQNVSLLFNGEKIEVEVVRGKSILEACLDQGMDLSYSCQNGTCTLCKAILINGKVKVIGLKEKLQKLSSDEHLLCCSYPLTNNVHLEVQ